MTALTRPSAGCGLKEPEVSLSTLRDTQGILQVNRISIDASGTKEAAQEAVRQICALYGLPQGSVTVHGWTAADAERQG